MYVLKKKQIQLQIYDFCVDAEKKLPIQFSNIVQTNKQTNEKKRLTIIVVKKVYSTVFTIVSQGAYLNYMAETYDPTELATFHSVYFVVRLSL